VPTTPYNLAQEWLTNHAEEVVKRLFPAARLVGNDYVIGDLDGNEGDSLHITVRGSKTGRWKDFANGAKGGNFCALWKAAQKIAQNDHQDFFAKLQTFSGQSFGYIPPDAPIDWPKCLTDWSQSDAAKLVNLRGFSPEFVTWLHDEAHSVGIQYGRIVFPVIGPGGVVVGVHRYIDEEHTLKFSKGCKVHPLVFGDMGPITELHVHESRWDCYAEASASAWYLKSGVRFLSTLGAGNGKLIKGQVPLGTKVYCWEQHDSPGNNGKIPNEDWFKGLVANAGCEILRVKIPAQYKDLNDWIRAETVTESDLAEALSAAQPYRRAVELVAEVSLASKLFPPLSERPCYRVYEHPFEDEGKNWQAGVYLHAIEERTNRIINRRICSVVRVIAIIRTDLGKEHSYLLQFVSHGETVLRHEVIPQSLLVNRSDEFMMLLRSWGISALFEHRVEIRNYLDQEHKRFSAQHPEDFWELVKVVGWYSPSCFVLSNEIIGDQNGVWFQGNGEHAQYASSGTLEKWQSDVAQHAQDNPYLAFAICCALSGPLLGPLNVLGAGFHLLGDSTCGKTTALLVGSSLWGPPKFMLSWRQTANRLESQAASRSDTLMTIDESHMIDPRTLDASIYLLLGGVAKGRMKRDATAAHTAHWRICVLSSGERGLETHLTAANIDHKAGQSVRICDIPVSGSYGVFDKLPPSKSAAAFADMLRDNTAKVYGTPGPAFVSRLIKEMPALDLHAELTEIVKTLNFSQLSAQQARVWRSFALVGLAGELATRWGIVPWKEGFASNVAADLFEAWRKAQPETSGSKEHAQILELVRDAINTHGTSQFSDLEGATRTLITPEGKMVQESEIRVVNRMGYWKDDDEKRIYLFTSEGLKRATKAHDWRRVLRALEEAGAFAKKAQKQISIATRIPGENRIEHLYWIDPDKLLHPCL
jgi:putative DNA primase/helicase